MGSWECCGLCMAGSLCPFLPRGPQVLLASPAVSHHPRTWESITTVKEQVCLMMSTWERIYTLWEFTFGRTPDQERIWVLMGCGPRWLGVHLFWGCLTGQPLKYQPPDQSVTSLQLQTVFWNCELKLSSFFSKKGISSEQQKLNKGMRRTRESNEGWIRLKDITNRCRLP